MNRISTNELYGPPKVGGDCLSYCTKCKMELAHVIIAMLDTKPKRVICKTCKSQHNFKGAPATSTRSGAKKTAKSTIPKTVVRAAELWQEKIAASQAGNEKPYSVKDSYKKADVINHSKFGMGVVEEVRTNGKMIVFFREGEKILVWGHGAN